MTASLTTERAAELIGRFNDCRIAVVGDFILDRYIWGRASRISQEAPVPVVRVQRESASLGGAANVLRNIRSLGADASAFGVVGDDVGGGMVREFCRDAGIAATGVVTDPERKTTVKTRVIAENQQVVRIDDEIDTDVSASIQEEVVHRLRQTMHQARLNAIIIEDYNKGMISPKLATAIRDSAAARSVTVALDPHPGNPVPVTGLAILTPNRSEAFAMSATYYREPVKPFTHDQALRNVGRNLMKQWRPEMLLITLGAGGMALFERDGEPHHIPTVAKEVFDVAGAGDTVIAAAVTSIAAGATPVEAAIIANHAGGIVVGKVGTASAGADELLDSFS